MRSRRVIYHPQPTAVRSTSTSGRYQVRGNVVSISDSPAFARIAALDLPEMDDDGLGCARGVRSAFIIEASMALLGYGIWLLWHFVR